MRNEAREDLANYLLNHCFLIGTLESTKEKYYLLLNNEEEMQTIFRPLGYTILINKTLRVAQLINQHELGRVELRKYESILLLILRLLYVEKRESLRANECMVVATVEEIEQEYDKLNLPKKLDRHMLEDALRVFRRYNLALPIDRMESDASRVQILPSVMLAMPEKEISLAYEETREKLLQYQKAKGVQREEDGA